MAAVVRAYRHHTFHGPRPLPQVRLARWLHITQAQLSRIENGHNRIRDLDTLIHYARCLGIPATLLWFDLGEVPAVPQREQPPELVRLPGGRAVPAASASVQVPIADSLLAQLEQYVTTDMLCGPRSLIPVIEQQMVFLDQLLASSSGRGRDRLLYVSARYAEFMGWLRQDTGDLNAAMSWSNTALDKVEEFGDPRFLSYVKMRKSNIASDAGNPRLAIALATDALSDPDLLTPRVRAVALRQQAYGHASSGDPVSCARALDRAYELAAEVGDEHPSTDMAAYCTTGFVAMEAAHCWVELGKPALALETLQNGLANWRPDSRRDLGVGMARLVLAHAGLGQPDEALTVAGHALNILIDTGSARTVRQLRIAAGRLEALGYRGHASELGHALAQILRKPAPTRSMEWT
ncbi:XRE family transcriptional regulator [Nocardia sp. NPDC050435]|uniref:XRE family transcriptional regulator n=1 Tax=Nocardia sp. NPDC050435 TaxID=3155040 RepID=UPI0033F5C220